MAATVQSSSSFVATASVTSGSVPLPTGWQANDVLYLFCELVASTGTITAPAGYSTVVTGFHSTGSTSATMAVFRKVLTASESAPSVTCTSGRLVVAGILVRGADTTTPEDVTATTDAGGSVTGTTGSVVAPSISPTNAAALLLTCHGIRNGSNGITGSFAPPSGMNEEQDITSAVAASSNASLEVSSLQLSASGATGTKTATATVSGSETFNTQGVSVAVRPASSGASLTQGVTDSVTMSDAFGFDRGMTIAETLTALDALAFNRGLVVPDTLALADSTTQATGKGVSVDDTLALADALSLSQGYGVAINDTLALADALATARDMNLSIPDTLALADALSLGRSLTIADALAVADTLARGFGISPSDVVTMADAMAFDRAITLADALALADSVSPSQSGQLTVNLSDSVTMADAVALARAISTGITDSVTATDAIVASLGLNIGLSDALALADLLSTERAITLTVDDLIAASDMLAFGRAISLAESLVLADEISTAGAIDFLITVADSLGISDEIAGVLFHQPASADTVKSQWDALLGGRRGDPGAHPRGRSWLTFGALRHPE